MRTALTEPRRALTGVRGLAAWWVVAYHFREVLPRETPLAIVRIIDRGYLAVDIFFVLSGYVIAVNYSRWFCGASRLGRAYLTFLALRLSRIYPLHLAMLVFFLSIPIGSALWSHHPSKGDMHLPYYILSYFLMQGWGFADGPAWNVPAWSISTEWMAYLLFPLATGGIGRITATPARSLAFIAACAALLQALALLRVNPNGMEDFQWFGLARCLCEFAMGIGVYRLLETSPSPGAHAPLALLGSAGGVALYCYSPSLEYTILPACFAALVFGLAQDRGLVAAALRNGALQWLGLVSYSTYLSHDFLKIWIKIVLVRSNFTPPYLFPLYILAVLAASVALYGCIERPAQIFCRRLIRSRSGAVLK